MSKKAIGSLYYLRDSERYLPNPEGMQLSSKDLRFWFMVWYPKEAEGGRLKERNKHPHPASCIMYPESSIQYPANMGDNE